MAQEPYQLMNGPFVVYIKPITVASPAVELPPDIDDPPTGLWELFGVSGDKDITEDGITVNLPQSISMFRGLGSTAVRKAFRTEEDVIIEFTLADASVENFARGLNDAAIDLAGNHRKIQLLRGAEVSQASLLLYGDGKSAYGNFNSYLWLPRASHVGEMTPKIVKGEPIGLSYKYQVLNDDDYGLGVFDMGDAVGS